VPAGFEAFCFDGEAVTKEEFFRRLHEAGVKNIAGMKRIDYDAIRAEAMTETMVFGTPYNEAKSSAWKREKDRWDRLQREYEKWLEKRGGKHGEL